MTGSGRGSGVGGRRIAFRMAKAALVPSMAAGATIPRAACQPKCSTQSPNAKGPVNGAEGTCLLQHPNGRRNRRWRCLRPSCVECPGGAAETERNSRRQGDGRWRKRRGVDDERRYGELPAPPAIEAETRVHG